MDGSNGVRRIGSTDAAETSQQQRPSEEFWGGEGRRWGPGGEESDREEDDGGGGWQGLIRVSTESRALGVWRGMDTPERRRRCSGFQNQQERLRGRARGSGGRTPHREGCSAPP